MENNDINTIPKAAEPALVPKVKFRLSKAFIGYVIISLIIIISTLVLLVGNN